METVRDLQDQIAQIERELKESMTRASPIHSTPMPQFSSQSDSGIITTKQIDNSKSKETTRYLHTPLSYGFNSGSGAKPKVLKSSRTQGKIVTPVIQENPAVLVNDTPIETVEDKPQVRGKEKHRDIKVANYDGTNDWNDYRSHFEACASINGWDDHDKGLYLAAALRGQAQSVLGDLPEDRKGQFEYLVKSLEERFAPPNQTELYRVQLKERRQRASETLPELGQAVQRLVNKAYPRAPGEVRETLAMEHFIDSLVNSEIRIKVKQSRPSNLNTAICLAVELETFYKAEYPNARLRTLDTMDNSARGRIENKNESSDKIERMLEAMNEQLASMRKELDEFKKNNTRQKQGDTRPFACYNCGKPGHMARNCPVTTRSPRGPTSTKDPNVKIMYSKRRSNRRRSPYLGTNTVNCEPGLYVEVKVNGTTARFLVDTGASISLVSNALFEKFIWRDRPKVYPINQDIIAANGATLQVMGKAVFHIQLGNYHTVVEAAISDVPVEGILGLDFLKDNNCKIDLQKAVLIQGHQQVPTFAKGRVEVKRFYDKINRSRPRSQHRNTNGLRGSHCKQRRCRSDLYNNPATVNVVASKVEERDRLNIDLRQLQEADMDIQIVKRWIESNSRPSFHSIGKYSYVVKSLWAQWDSLKLVEGILYRVHLDSGEIQALVSMTERRRILRYMHETAAHFGIKETLGRVREKYYWPGVRGDTWWYISGCDVCNEKKRSSPKSKSPTGPSPKFTNQGQAVYQVFERNSDVTRLFKCGRNGKDQVDQVHRMGPCSDKIFRRDNIRCSKEHTFENIVESGAEPDSSGDAIVGDTSQVVNAGVEIAERRRRPRKPIVWMKDCDC